MPPTTPILLTVFALASVFVLLRAESAGYTRLTYAAKPLAMVSIGLIAVLAWPVVSETYRQLIVAGMILSMVGDVFLMLPKDRFMAGLGAFLLAHIAYIAAFAGRLEDVPILPFLPFTLAFVFVARLLWPDLRSERYPVLIYSAALTVMAALATGVAVSEGSLSAVACAVGAVLFVLSDTALAFDRFVGAFGSARYFILTTYFAAQLLIALSVFA
ncbi:MAG: putative membrane protein YhhN [Rhodothermales bacterium]|jgi:uncharacterized membrane protein YhhN